MDISELESRVHEHRIFFDNLVELVPAKFYLPKEDQENSWHHGKKKNERAAAKLATKKNLKRARRDRLDPDKFTSTLKMLQQKETEKPVDLEKKNEAQHAANSRLQGKESRASTYEELRERLKKRIEMLRAKRNAETAAAAAKNSKNWQNQKKLDSQKRKRNTKGDVEMPTMKHRKQDPVNTEDSDWKSEPHKSASMFEFGRVKMGLDQHMMSGRKKKRKDSKEQLLAKATKLQLEMQDDKKGQEVALKHSWSVALNRASGEKVFDDPNLLKRSIKREKYQQQKSSKKWLERKETERKAVKEKQQKRMEHIKEQKQQKKERKIAKREKKLLRPGFEGRREGFINN